MSHFALAQQDRTHRPSGEVQIDLCGIVARLVVYVARVISNSSTRILQRKVCDGSWLFEIVSR